jgi:integrase/recombinase XerD
MLERYFVKPSTIDRIRASWIAPGIEAYVTWLAENEYSAAVVHGRVPILVRFGEFAREAGAQVLADLPSYVDSFIAHRVAERAGQRADGRTGPTLVKDLRAQIEGMLAVALPGFERTGRRHHPRPFVTEAPGFFDYLVTERGLRPATVEQYRHYLDRFEVYLTRVGVRRLEELSPALLSAFIVERQAPAWPAQRCGRVPALSGSSCAMPTGRGRSHATCPGPLAGLRPIGWPAFPVRSPGRT